MTSQPISPASRQLLADFSTTLALIKPLAPTQDYAAVVDKTKQAVDSMLARDAQARQERAEAN